MSAITHPSSNGNDARLSACVMKCDHRRDQKRTVWRSRNDGLLKHSLGRRRKAAVRGRTGRTTWARGELDRGPTLRST